MALHDINHGKSYLNNFGIQCALPENRRYIIRPHAIDLQTALTLLNCIAFLLSVRPLKELKRPWHYEAKIHQLAAMPSGEEPDSGIFVTYVNERRRINDRLRRKPGCITF